MTLAGLIKVAAPAITLAGLITVWVQPICKRQRETKRNRDRLKKVVCLYLDTLEIKLRRELSLQARGATGKKEGRQVPQRYTSSLLTHFVAKGETVEHQFETFAGILAEGALLSREILTVRKATGSQHPAERLRRWSVTIPKSIPPDGDLNDLFSASVVCFADIPVSNIEIHTQKYSPFGIAFTKDFLVRQGASPVFYVCGSTAGGQSTGRSW